MKSQKKHVLVYAIVLSGILSAILSSSVRSEEKQWVVFKNDLSPEIKRINIPLNFTSSESIFYESNSRQVKSEAIPGSNKKDDYKQQFDFGVAVDGYQYLMQVRDTEDYKIISSNAEQLCAVKILRMAPKGKPTLVKEGNIVLQRSIEIPLEIPAQQLGIPSKESLAGSAIIEVYRSDPPAYQGRFEVRLRGSLSGSSVIENASINVSITCRNNSTDIKDRQLSLSIRPFDDRLASLTAGGKLSDILMLGSAKLAVEKIASDSSQMVLVLLNGQLNQEKNPQTTMETGKPFPEFTRIELVNRRLLTLSDLKKQAGAEGYIVLVFGDFKRTMRMPSSFDPASQVRNLALDEEMVVKILKSECEKTVVVGFVCRQLLLSDLYEKWLGRELDFHVLSEFSNPMEMRFIVQGMEQYGGFQRHETGETLRGQLGLPIETVITALINGRGELVSINPDAGKELSGALVQINKLIKEGKTAVQK